MHVELGRRRASVRVTNLQVEDYFTLFNSFTDASLQPSVPATVSFIIEWQGGDTAITIGDGVNFEAEVFEGTVSVHWTAHEDGFAFSSLTSRTEFAEIGRERNGRFL